MPMRMTVKDQSVLQKRAAAEAILRLTGPWGRKSTNKQKHLLGPRCPACGLLPALISIQFSCFNNSFFLFITTFFSIRHIYDIIIMVSNLFYCIDLGYKSNTDQSLQYRNVNFLIAYKTIIVFIFLPVSYTHLTLPTILLV